MSKLSRKDAIAALERGDASALGQPAEAVEAARKLLGVGEADLDALARLPEPLLELVLAEAILHDRQSLLTRAAQGPKAVARVAKKELYRARSEGKVIELPQSQKVASAPAPTGSTTTSTAAAESFPHLLSHADQGGLQNFLGAHLDAHGHIEAFTGEFDDQAGLLRIDIGEVSRRNYKQLVRQLRTPRPGEFTLGETSAARFAGALHRASALGMGSGVSPHAVDRLLRAFPGKAEDDRTASESWPALPDNEERAAVGTSSDLFLQPEMFAWTPGMDPLQAIGRKLLEVSTSQLYVDDAQRRQQGDRVVADAVAAFFTREERNRYARRLFINADHFEQTGRAEVAKKAAAVARALRGETPIEQIPFLRTLFDKALYEQVEGARARMSARAKGRASSKEEGSVSPLEVAGPLEGNAPANEPEQLERTPGGLIIPPGVR
jgi:hypothetical protein